MPRQKETPAIPTVHEALDVLTIEQLQPLVALLPTPARPTRKGEFVALLEQHLAGTQLRALWEQLDATQQLAVAETIHDEHGVFNADFRRAKSAHILHRHPQCFSRILLLFVSGFSFLLSWIVMLLFRYSSRIVETQMLFVLDIVARAACVQPWSCGQVCEIALLNSRV